MNLFKKLFSSQKPKKEEAKKNTEEVREKEKKENTEESKEEKKERTSEPSFKGIPMDKHFVERYTEDKIDESMLGGCLKMVESYFMDNQIKRKIDQPINHPDNLDQTIDDGMGFHMYCKAFKMEDQAAIMFLAYPFADYMVKKFGFSLYNDSKPEYPLHSMTVKYHKNNEVFLSFYPFEYALKVLNYQARFIDLHDQIQSNFEKIKNIEDIREKIQNLEQVIKKMDKPD